MRHWSWLVITLALALCGGMLWYQHRGEVITATLDPGEAQAQITPASYQREEKVTISFVGDMMLASGVGRYAAAHGAKSLFAGVSSVLLNDDVTIGNLECAVSTSGAAQDKKYTFRANPAVLPGVRAGGIDAVTLANNHSMDFGRAALLDTVEYLHRAGIAYAGAGANMDSASRAALIPAGSRTIALVAASRVLPSTNWHAGANRPGVASAYDAARVLAEIGAARQQAGIVIVFFHWGTERAIEPAAYQRKLAYRCIDAGADLVIGSHPHVLQGFEYYRGKLIAYSLGNFIFSSSNRSTIILQTTMTGGKQTARAIPCRIANYRPWVLTKPAARQEVFQALQQRSYGVSVSEDGVLSGR